MVETTVFQSTTLDTAPTGTCMVGSLLLGTLGSWVQQQTWIPRTSMLGSELLDTGHPPPTLMLGCQLVETKFWTTSMLGSQLLQIKFPTTWKLGSRLLRVMMSKKWLQESWDLPMQVEMEIVHMKKTALQPSIIHSCAVHNFQGIPQTMCLIQMMSLI
jgi:hypothetical protein